MTTKTSRQTMMQHKSENEDRLISQLEDDFGSIIFKVMH